jgi:plastocyanin
MKKEFVLALIIVLLAIVIVTYSFDKKYPTYLGGKSPLVLNKNIITHTVEIRASEFYPPSLIIARGEKVIWINTDNSPHTVTSENRTELSSPIIPPNETYYHVFENEGKFEYNCSLRPILSGEITVGPERDN